MHEAAGRDAPRQKTALFTSDLSVNEFLLVRESGFRPLGLCSLQHLSRRIPAGSVE